MEIGNYFHLLSVTLGGGGRIGNSDVSDFNAIAQINFTMLFLIVMALVNIRKVRSVIAGGVNVATSILLLAVTSTVGMYLLYELRESYQRDAEFELFGMSSMNIAVRYITYAFTAGTIITLYEYYRNDLLDPVSTLPWRSLAFDAVLYLCVLILASCELMNIAAHTNVLDADKFGLSILWGVFSLGVIVIGIAKAKKHLRIGAFVLLAVTLVKLFFYDATDLPTIPKTLLFVSIGLLMLGISFLYNKFRNVIFVSVGNEEEVEE